MRWFTLLLIGCVSFQATAADINVPSDHATIQAAIVAANPGDVVIVAPGTYPEAIDFLGKAITVRSTDPTNPLVVTQTIIDGHRFGRLRCPYCPRLERFLTIEAQHFIMDLSRARWSIRHGSRPERRAGTGRRNIP